MLGDDSGWPGIPYAADAFSLTAQTPGATTVAARPKPRPTVKPSIASTVTTALASVLPGGTLNLGSSAPGTVLGLSPPVAIGAGLIVAGALWFALRGGGGRRRNPKGGAARGGWR